MQIIIHNFNSFSLIHFFRINFFPFLTLHKSRLKKAKQLYKNVIHIVSRGVLGKWFNTVTLVIMYYICMDMYDSTGAMQLFIEGE
jgi:methylaspartate ammonia-lyase